MSMEHEVDDGAGTLPSPARAAPYLLKERSLRRRSCVSTRLRTLARICLCLFIYIFHPPLSYSYEGRAHFFFFLFVFLPFSFLFLFFFVNSISGF